ncbi:MAG: hypothetical protein JNK14_17285 [Chitinophagaceae bacterium]|nr:hypothetical protein [Chitinophagaceae bacterium]
MKSMINTRLIAVALVALFTVASAAPALANDGTKVIPVELKFIGNVKNQPLFHMNFNSSEESTYTITVRDEYGNVLYKENVKGGVFTKKFMLNTEELGDADLKFEVTGKGYEKPVVFEVNKYTRFVEDVVINKVK